MILLLLGLLFYYFIYYIIFIFIYFIIGSEIENKFVATQNFGKQEAYFLIQQFYNLICRLT